MARGLVFVSGQGLKGNETNRRRMTMTEKSVTSVKKIPIGNKHRRNCKAKYELSAEEFFLIFLEWIQCTI